MAETAKERFWREWAIDGMPKDKQRLAEAAWAGATEAVRMNQAAGGEVVALTAWVGTMQASNGTNYYVCVGFPGGKYITTQVYDLRGRADYDVAEWKHILGQGPEPDVLAFDTEGTTPPAAQVQQEATPAARWAAAGEPDPHGSRYTCERAALAGGHLTDDEVANAVFLDPNIANLTIAKDRIRWLSRALAPRPAADALGAGRDELDRFESRLTWESSQGSEDGAHKVACEALMRLRQALAQAPAVRVTDEMVERARAAYKAKKHYHTGDFPDGPIRSAADLLRNDDQAWRAAMEAAFGQGKANGR